MSTSYRVIYNNEVNQVVTGSTPDQIMSVMRSQYAELSNGNYSLSAPGADGVITMTITLRSGSKATSA